MTLNEVIISEPVEHLSVELPNGKTLYLLCGCCDRYIKKTEMTLIDYVMTLKMCPTCYTQQKQQLVLR